jgi:hypothetical protein
VEAARVTVLVLTVVVLALLVTVLGTPPQLVLTVVVLAVLEIVLDFGLKKDFV